MHLDDAPLPGSEVGTKVPPRLEGPHPFAPACENRNLFFPLEAPSVRMPLVDLWPSCVALLLVDALSRKTPQRNGRRRSTTVGCSTLHLGRELLALGERRYVFARLPMEVRDRAAPDHPAAAHPGCESLSSVGPEPQAVALTLSRPRSTTGSELGCVRQRLPEEDTDLTAALPERARSSMLLGELTRTEATETP
jgi:hypothetical protein